MSRYLKVSLLLQLYHSRLGMEVYFNIGPEVQPQIPADIPTWCSQCQAFNQAILYG